MCNNVLGRARKRARIGRNSEWLMGKLRELDEKEFPPRHPKKEFVAENPEIPILQSYKGAAPETFWDKFPVNRNERGAVRSNLIRPSYAK